MRRGEVLGFRWSDVDLEGARIHIQQTRLSVAYEVILSEPKTAKGRRSVALDAETVLELKKHPKRQLEERMAAGGPWQDK
jgi:integrase